MWGTRMTALEDLDRLLADPDRRAVLPREVEGSPSSVQRALRRRCADRTLQRIGRGIYARSRSKLFDIVPEVLPKLGYEILPTPRLTNLSFKHGGGVWRLDRPCRRLIVKHGVKAVFESPCGKLYRTRPVRMTPMHEPPSRRETELNFSLFDRCQSYARAEKDLIVRKALRAWESFSHPDATLALEGGTCLVVYHRLVKRFSDDIDMRVILKDELEHGPPERRIAAFREVSTEFAAHVHEALPFLKPTRKGRFRRRDGRFASHIFDYHGRMPDPCVVEGLKLELVQQPNRLPLHPVPGLSGKLHSVISPLEIALGKWSAVTTRLPGRARIYPDLVRHPWDLGAMRAALALGMPPRDTSRAAMLEEHSGPEVTVGLRGLGDPSWGDNYADYAQRMGMRPIADSFFQHADSAWETLRSEVALAALAMDLVPARDRPEVQGMAEGRWETPGPSGPLRRKFT